MNDPVAGYLYWYYIGTVILLALLSAAAYKWFQYSKEN
jgi:hypothetical protein